MLDEVRKKYPDFQVLPVLFSFELADSINIENGFKIGEHPAVFSDENKRALLVKELNRIF